MKRNTAVIGSLAAFWLCGSVFLCAEERMSTTLCSFGPNQGIAPDPSKLFQPMDYTGKHLYDVASVAGGGNMVVVKTNGTVWVSGQNSFGQLGAPYTVKIASAGAVCISGLTNVIQAACGSYHVMALKSDGSVWSWGTNWSGVLGDAGVAIRATPGRIAALSNVTAIAAGDYHALAVRSNGTVWAWGDNSWGQLGDGTTSHRLVPVQVSGGLTGVTAVAGGGGYSVAVRNDGTVWAWGGNGGGQLGNGTTGSQTNPVQVVGLTNITAVSAGGMHCLARRNDGTVWAWGYNNEGQLGNGTTSNQTTPVQVTGLSNVIAVSASTFNSAALRSDGTVWTWGENSNGSLGDNSYTNDNRSVPGPVRTADGTVVSNAIGVANGGTRVVCLWRRASPESADQTKICGNDRTTKISLSCSDPDSRAFELRVTIVTPPANGTLSVGYGPNVYYTPVPGYTGGDGFTWQVSDELGTSSVATCTLDVRDTPPGGTNRIALIVNSNLYASISNEVERLKNDILWDGKDVVVHVKSYGAEPRIAPGDSFVSVYEGDDVGLWNYLHDQYTSNHLEGAILIGGQPDAITAATNFDSSYYYKADDATYSCMSRSNYFSYGGGGSSDIWVTRINANDPVYYSIGESGMTRRALDANHYYRTGQLRYPHRSFWGCNSADIPSREYRDLFDGYVAVPPQAEEKSASDALRSGCMFDWQSSHGYPDHGDAIAGGVWNSTAFWDGAFQANFVISSSCAIAIPISPAHQQMFTKHGGVVLTRAPYGIWMSAPGYLPTQEQLMRGASLGECWVRGGLGGFAQHVDGDLSVQIMQGPPNDMPTMSLSASKTTVVRNEPFTLTATITDANAASETNVFENYKHKVEWYMAGWDYGRKDPTVVMTNAASVTNKQVQYEHVFTSNGTYTVRALVMDEWRAVAWKEVTLTVVNPAVTCAITSPTNGAAVYAGSNMPITVTAGTTYGAVTNVEFYVDGVMIGSVTNAPFTCNWSPTAAEVGVHLITAKAVDWQGATTNAAAVSVRVLSRVACALTAPADWATVKVGTNVEIAAEATSLDAAITNVAFYVNGTKLGDDASAPFSFILPNVTAGVYALTAVASDSLGQTGVAATVTLWVTASGMAEEMATGGTPVRYWENGTNYTAHVFTNTAGPATLAFQVGANVEYLVVAGGGGGGGGYEGGGGGAGGFRTGRTNLAAAAYTVTVGAGGNGARWSGANEGANGLASSIAISGAGVVGATGGGRGSSDSPTYAGGNGGSGGGGGLGGAAGSGTTGEGNAGGASPGSYSVPQGGGGGAGGAGQVGGSGMGMGGAGASSTFSGESVTYAAGGSGGYRASVGYTGSAGGANTGHGGGGGGGPGTGIGGKGGSGIVIVRYVTGSGAEVANRSASDITTNSVTLNGTLRGSNTVWDAWGYWGPTDGGQNPVAWSNSVYVGAFTLATAASNIACSVSGITTNTTYYYYTFFASNAARMVWAAPSMSFVSLLPPTVDNGPLGATGLGVGSATLHGRLLSQSADEMLLCWGTNDCGTSATGSWPNVVRFGAQVAPASVSTVLSGLTYGIRYWYRAYASNAVGEVWSAATNFVTASSAGGVSATGGTVMNYTLNGTNYTAHIFTTVGTTSLNVTAGGDIEVLVVAGGGGGGGRQGAGGGAGGLVYSNVFPVIVSNYTVTVGGGGAKGTGAGVNGTSGTNSVFHGIVAMGGGFGACGSTSSSSTNRQGGSGGGGGRIAGNASGGLATAGQGNKGGDGKTTVSTTGGGGGAGAAGQGGTNAPSNKSGDGGIGLQYNMAGTNAYYAGGGGGGGGTLSTPAALAGSGGLGGGGAGTADTVAGESGAANTGGGGGGGGYNSNGGDGGAGGSGIVIVRYVANSGAGIANSNATSITTTSAVLNGTLRGSNSVWDVWVYWGATDGMNNPNAWSNAVHLGDITLMPAATNITYALSDLVTNTTYYYTFFATNAAGGFWATPSASFVVLAPPTLDYGQAGATGIGVGTATLNGRLLTQSVDDMAICWGTHDCGTASTSAWPNVVRFGAQTAPASVATSLAGLTYGVRYWYRVYATNSFGGVWSAATNFVTAAPPGRNGYQMKIGLSGYVNRSETLTNFPVLVVFSNNVGGSGFTYGKFATTNGWDLRFATNDLPTTNSLNYEIESWNPNGVSYVWVQVPAVPGDGSGAIWANWGAPAASNRLPCTTNGATWRNGYIAVWHFSESSGSILDSSSNKLNGTLVGSPAFTTSGAAIGSAWDFTQSNTQRISVANDSRLNPVNAVTLEAWARQTGRTAGAGGFDMIVSRGLGFSADFSKSGIPYYLGNGMGGQINTNQIGFGFKRNDLNPYWQEAGDVPAPTPTNVLFYWSGTYDRANLRLYRNGVLDASMSSASEMLLGMQEFTIADCASSPGSKRFTGLIDEVRVSSVARSSNWVWACYQTIASNEVFNHYGAIYGIANTFATNVQPSSATLQATLRGSNAYFDVWAYWGPTDGTNNPAAWSNKMHVGEFTLTTTFSNIACTVSDLRTNRTYCYTFFATNAATHLWALPSTNFIVTPAPSVEPAAPTGLTATAAATNRIDLAWSDNANDETGYVVDRSLDTSVWDFVTTTGPNITHCSDTGLAANTLYYYRVAASNAAGLSAYANASATTLPDSVSTTRTLTVVAARGGVTPGTVTVIHNTELSQAITHSPVSDGAATQYVCTGWTLTGNEPVSGIGTNVTLTLTNDATLTWQWQTQYWLATVTNGNGIVTATDGWHVSGGSTTLTATAAANWHFTGWTGDTNGCGIAGNTIAAAMSQARSITANFAISLATNGTPYEWLVTYGLTNGTFDVEELGDPDGDGMASWQEWLAGTDPTNGRSCLVVSAPTNPVSADWKFMVRWQTVAGKIYTLQATTNVLEGFFDVMTNTPATPGENVYTTAVDRGEIRFYRVKVCPVE